MFDVSKRIPINASDDESQPGGGTLLEQLASAEGQRICRAARRSPASSRDPIITQPLTVVWCRAGWPMRLGASQVVASIDRSMDDSTGSLDDSIDWRRLSNVG